MIDQANIKQVVARLLNRFHVILFVIVIIGGLALLIFFLNGVLTRASDTSNTAGPNASAFDQATMEKLEQLNSGDKSSNIKLPDGRINPFVE